MGIPRRSALYLIIVRNRESAASDNAFASRLFLSSPLMLSVSIPIAAARLTIAVLALWCASSRIQAIR